MAKHLDQIRMYITSATTDQDEATYSAEYRVCENDLTKRAGLVVSGVDYGTETVSGFWDAVIADIEAIEGI